MLQCKPDSLPLEPASHIVVMSPTVDAASEENEMQHLHGKSKKAREDTVPTVISGIVMSAHS